MVENDTNDEPTMGEADERTAAAEGSRTRRDANAAPATDVQAYIGRQLRAVYDDVAKQPIPDRFLALMQQLEAKGGG